MGFSRVCEENKRLHSMLEEKDRRIHLLEFKVNQLMKDTRTIAEENARYQKENSTLVKLCRPSPQTKKTHLVKRHNNYPNFILCSVIFTYFFGSDLLLFYQYVFSVCKSNENIEFFVQH